jgi:hypothetical protein
MSRSQVKNVVVVTCEVGRRPERQSIPRSTFDNTVTDVVHGPIEAIP